MPVIYIDIKHTLDQLPPLFRIRFKRQIAIDLVLSKGNS